MGYFKTLGRNLLIMMGIILTDIIALSPLAVLYFFAKLPEPTFIIICIIWGIILVIALISYGVYSEEKKCNLLKKNGSTQEIMSEDEFLNSSLSYGLTQCQLLEIYELIFTSAHSNGFKISEIKDLLFDNEYVFLDTPKPNWKDNLTAYLVTIQYDKSRLNINKNL